MDALKSGRELNTAADGVGLTEPHTEPIEPARQLRLYLLALLLAPFIYMAACLGLMRSDVFIRHTQNAYVANMGYGLNLRNADCQVLIYGDSSAMVGVDPATLQARTGLSACNIADFAGMMRLNGTMVLDDYLAHNRRPDYLIILLAPEDLGPAWRHDGNYEAVLMRVRQRFDLGFLRMTLLHGEDVLSAISISGRYAWDWLREKPLSQDVWREREMTRGRFPDAKERMVNCPAEGRIYAPKRDWVENLRAHYGVQGTRVLIDVTPVPACDPALPIYSQQLKPGSGIIDNQLHTYPVYWYTKSGRLHLGSEGMMRLSNEIAAQINQARQTGQTH